MVKDLVKVDEKDRFIVEQKVDQFLTEAKAIEIVDDDIYQYAGELLDQEKAIYKFVEKTYEKTKKALNKAKAELMELIHLHIDPLDEAEKILKSKRSVWHVAQEEIRRKERIRVEAELRKQEEERRLDEAIETGDDSILEEPIFIPAVPVREIPKEKGHSFRDDWKSKVVNPALVPFPAYWVIDEKKIEKVVKATKGAVTIPGVKIWKEEIEAVRSR